MTVCWSYHSAWNVSFGTVKHLLHLTLLIFGQVGSFKPETSESRNHALFIAPLPTTSYNNQLYYLETSDVEPWRDDWLLTISRLHFLLNHIFLRIPLGLIPCNQVTVLREISLVMTPPTVSMPKVKGVTSNLRSWAGAPAGQVSCPNGCQCLLYLHSISLTLYYVTILLCSVDLFFVTMLTCIIYIYIDCQPLPSTALRALGNDD